MPREASKEVSKKIVHWDSEFIIVTRFAQFSVWNRLFFLLWGRNGKVEEYLTCTASAQCYILCYDSSSPNQNILLWHEARLKLVRDKWSETSVVKDTWILYFKLVSDVFFCRPFNNRYQPTLLPSIFITGVHPPSPHPKSPIWQRTEVVFAPKCKVTNSLAFDLFGEPDQF